MTLSAEDRMRFKREKAKEAISLAMESRWEEALKINRAVLKAFPEDVEALNRLGKALSELGQYGEAREAFRRAVEISPANIIARKNLRRLGSLEVDRAVPKQGSKMIPHLFIGESGKATTVSLANLGLGAVLLRMAPGDAVQLKVVDRGVVVEDSQGEYLGEPEPQLAFRLARLIRGGNTYLGAVTAINESSLVVVIREEYQHPSQEGILSFPAKVTSDEDRSYTHTPPLYLDLRGEEFERPAIQYWDEEGEVAIPGLPAEEAEEGPGL